jgi:hypothetical protein
MYGQAEENHEKVLVLLSILTRFRPGTPKMHVSSITTLTKLLVCTIYLPKCKMNSPVQTSVFRKISVLVLPFKVAQDDLKVMRI